MYNNSNRINTTKPENPVFHFETPCISSTTYFLLQYAVILIVIFLAQIALGVFAFLQIKNEQGFKESVDGSINKVFNAYATNKESKELVDLIQTQVR